MNLSRLKWATALVVSAFLVAFEYLRHVLFPALLHNWSVYLISVGVVFVATLVFNESVFRFVRRAQDALLRQNRQLATINAVAAATSAPGIAQSLDDILARLASAGDVDACAVLLRENGHVAWRAQCNMPVAVLGSALTEEDLGNGADLLIAEPDGAARRPIAQAMEAAGFRTTRVFPLRGQGRVTGALVVAARQRREFGPAEADHFAAVANHLAVALESARLNDALQRQANYLAAMIESSGNAVISMDRAGVIETWNRAAEQIYGWSKEEAVGRSFPMVPPDLMDEARDITARLWQGETLRNFETRRLRKDGEVIPVLLAASPVRDADGRVVGIVGNSTDRRERKRLERELLTQQRAMAVLKERERLARELHDGLGQVLGFVNTQSQAARELLARGRGDEAQACLKDLIEVAQDAHADVRDYILSLQAGAKDSAPFVPALREYLRRYASMSGISTELVMPPGMPEPSLGPVIETQLMRIIQEALTNARRHADARVVRVHFLPASEGLAIEVVDDGHGFVMNGATDEGRHFGLRIMRDRAADIGGRVEIVSSPGTGTRVRVELPLSQPQGEPS